MVLLHIVHNVIRPFRYVTIVQPINLNLSRSYGRWVSRRPIAIVNQDELYECEDTTETKISQGIKISSRKRRKRKPFTQASKEAKVETSTGNKRTLNLKETDKLVTSLMSKLRSRKKREKSEEIVLEGHRLIEDALKAGLTPTTILFNDNSDIERLELPEDVALYKVPYKTIQLWSNLTTSPGLLGIFKTPDIHKNAVVDNALPLTVICDNIREPGNLGSIMRAVAGVGCEKLILMKGCVDLWDPKVLRSAAGTHFQLPIHAFPTWEQISLLISKDAHIFIADSNFGDEFLQNYSPDILQSSLNIFNIDPEDLKSKIILNNRNTEDNVPTNKKMMKQFLLKFPIVPYYSLDYTRKECVLILSGETEGFSFGCYKLLNERKGIRINIPLTQGVDSLNVGVALGIVAFEIKRQFLKRHN